MGIVWNNVAYHGSSGAVNAPLTFIAEEPSFVGSIGVGLDIFQNIDVGDPDANHVSVHVGDEIVRQESVPLSGLRGYCHIRL